MDLESRRRWDSYTKAKVDMFERTHIEEAPWWIVEAVDKKRARLNCIQHLLQQIPYKEVPHSPVALPDRVRDKKARGERISRFMYVPEIY